MPSAFVTTLYRLAGLERPDRWVDPSHADWAAGLEAGRGSLSGDGGGGGLGRRRRSTTELEGERADPPEKARGRASPAKIKLRVENERTLEIKIMYRLGGPGGGPGLGAWSWWPASWRPWRRHAAGGADAAPPHLPRANQYRVDCFIFCPEELEPADPTVSFYANLFVVIRLHTPHVDLAELVAAGMALERGGGSGGSSLPRKGTPARALAASTTGSGGGGGCGTGIAVSLLTGLVRAFGDMHACAAEAASARSRAAALGRFDPRRRVAGKAAAAADATRSARADDAVQMMRLLACIFRAAVRRATSVAADAALAVAEGRVTDGGGGGGDAVGGDDGAGDATAAAAARAGIDLVEQACGALEALATACDPCRCDASGALPPFVREAAALVEEHTILEAERALLKLLADLEASPPLDGGEDPVEAAADAVGGGGGGGGPGPCRGEELTRSVPQPRPRLGPPSPPPPPPPPPRPAPAGWAGRFPHLDAVRESAAAARRRSSGARAAGGGVDDASRTSAYSTATTTTTTTRGGGGGGGGRVQATPSASPRPSSSAAPPPPPPPPLVASLMDGGEGGEACSARLPAAAPALRPPPSDPLPVPALAAPTSPPHARGGSVETTSASLRTGSASPPAGWAGARPPGSPGRRPSLEMSVPPPTALCGGGSAGGGVAASPPPSPAVGGSPPRPPPPPAVVAFSAALPLQTLPSLPPPPTPAAAADLDSARALLREAVAGLEAARLRRGFTESLMRDGPPAVNEGYTNRLQVLKKHARAAISLTPRTRPPPTVLVDVVGMVIAGTAMAFAIWTVWLAQKYAGDQYGALYVLILVFGYIVKDRLKELGKRYLQPVAGYFGVVFYDRIVSATDGRGETVGTVSERVRVLDPSALNPRVRALRNYGAALGAHARAAAQPERVVAYSKTVNVAWAAVDRRLQGVGALSDIMRFDLAPLTRRMQAPSEPHFRLGRDGAGVEPVPCARVYHVNVVLRVRAAAPPPPPAGGGGSAGAAGAPPATAPMVMLLERARVVMNRDGIQRLEAAAGSLLREREHGRSGGHSAAGGGGRGQGLARAGTAKGRAPGARGGGGANGGGTGVLSASVARARRAVGWALGGGGRGRG